MGSAVTVHIFRFTYLSEVEIMQQNAQQVIEIQAPMFGGSGF